MYELIFRHSVLRTDLSFDLSRSVRDLKACRTPRRYPFYILKGKWN